MDHATPLWTPSPARIEQAVITRYRRWLTARRLVLHFQRDASVVGLRVDAVEPP